VNATGVLRLPRRRPVDVLAPAPSWRVTDRIGLGLCWAAGITLCALAAAIVLFMLFKGTKYLGLDMLFTQPQAELNQARSGGFLDPMIGTAVLTLMGVIVGAPAGIAAAVWLSEYGRPSWLARMIESGIEVVAGTPSIVLAIFGLLIFQQPLFSFLSFTAQGNAVFGRSFFAASFMMGLIALPLVFGGTREALQSIPAHVREASYALGKTKAATIRRVLLPAARPGIATGAVLGMGRIAGDTAIVVILLGASLQFQAEGDIPIVKTLRGTGSTLTSYVYNNSPAGEGNAPQKAYAAAFVLLLIVVFLNFAVTRVIGRGRGAVSAWKA
jgi:phosphate transport system permease protein